MRIQSKEFSILQHFGSGRDIPQMNELQTTSFPSVMSDSIMVDSTTLQAHG